MVEGVAAKRKISKGQIKKIHALKHALQLSDDDYRKLIYVNFYPATSSKDLLVKQAEVFIENLEGMAIEKGVWTKQVGKLTYEDLGYREGMASPGQLRKIEVMWKNVSKHNGTRVRTRALRNWLQGHFGVSDLRFLTAARANDVIYALGQMEGRRSTGSAGRYPAARYHGPLHDRSAAEM
jgi:hypothetical protein